MDPSCTAGDLLPDSKVPSSNPRAGNLPKNGCTLPFIEPTCAYCTVGSYAPLSVCCLSVVCTLDLTEMGEKNSYLKKYFRGLVLWIGRAHCQCQVAFYYIYFRQ